MNKPSFYRSEYDLLHLPVEELLLQRKYIRLTKFAMLYLVVIALACYIAIAFQIQRDILACIPLFLAFASKIVFYFHDKWNLKFVLFLILVFLTSSLLEYWGIRTEWAYHKDLSWRTTSEHSLFLAGVLGFSWMLIAYSAGVLVKNAIPTWNLLLQTMVGGAIMVSLSLLIDSFMLSKELISANVPALPAVRYVVLFGLACLAQLYFHRKFFQIENVVAIVYLLLVFVGLLGLS